MYSRWCLTNMLYNQCLKTAKPSNLNFNDDSQSSQSMEFEWKAPNRIDLHQCTQSTQYLNEGVMTTALQKTSLVCYKELYIWKEIRHKKDYFTLDPCPFPPGSL